MARALRVTMIVGAIAVLATVPSNARAACGGGGNDHILARFVRNHAETIVLARVGARDEAGLVTLHVIERYRGQAGTTIDVDDESLPCRSFSDWTGDRVLAATGLAKTDDYPTPTDEPDRWWIAWHHYPGFGWQAGMTDRYRGLDSLLAELQLLPATASDPVDEGVGPNASVLFGAGSLAWVLFALDWRRRTRRPAST